MNGVNSVGAFTLQVPVGYIEVQLVGKRAWGVGNVFSSISCRVAVCSNQVLFSCGFSWRIGKGRENGKR